MPERAGVLEVSDQRRSVPVQDRHRSVDQRGTDLTAHDTLTVEEVGQLVRKWFAPPRKLRVAATRASRIASSPTAAVRPGFCIGVTDELLTAVWSAEERRRLDLAHVAVVFERSSGLVSVFGPFVGPVEASAFADRYTLEIGDMAEEVPTIAVAPLDPSE